MPPAQRTVRTATLEIAYEESGPADGIPVILMHGFPDDPRTWDGVAAPLSSSGLRVVAPWLRGYGGTGFRNPVTPRSGQQAALGTDLRDFMDALGIGRALLAGYDWGGRAACILAALWPERVRCLVTGDGYNIQNIPRSGLPAAPWVEHQLWYQYYFHAPRGRAGLEAHRRDLARLLWRLWSPSWTFDEDTFGRTAPAFDNPDFVDVVIHSYRHRYGYAEGDPALQPIERALEAQPAIPVPTISLCGADDGVATPPAADADAGQFTGRYERRVLAGVGHNIPQEAPQATLRALRDLMAG